MVIPQASQVGVSVPPEATWENLERLDWHLWVLAVFLIFVLGASLLSFMFPTVFWVEQSRSVEGPQRAFFGFSILIALVLIYLLQRQSTVRRLKRQLYEAQMIAAAATREASIQSFQTLPAFNQFRDALAMEYRRASSAGAGVSVMVITIKEASLDYLGYLAGVLRSLLRQGETLYKFSDRGFGIILPGMPSNGAAAFATQAEGVLGLSKEKLQVTIANFPEDVRSLTELEHRLRQHGNGHV